MKELLPCPKCGKPPLNCIDNHLTGPMFSFSCCGRQSTSCHRDDSACDAWNYNEAVVDGEFKRLRETIEFQKDQLATANKALRVFKVMTEKGY